MKACRPAFVLLAFSLLLRSPLSAQRQEIYPDEKAWNAGIMLHSQGKGLFFQTAKQKELDKFRLVDIGLLQVKHPREMRIVDFQAETRPYVFGKANSLFILNANLGRKRVFASRYDLGNIQVALNYSIGPNLAILKPVYYNVLVMDTITNIPHQEPQRFNANNPEQHVNIVGGASPFKGINQLGFMPGGNARLSLAFEWGRDSKHFYSLQAGTQIQAFPKRVPIFAFPEENKNVFIQFFLGFAYGIRS